MQASDQHQTDILASNILYGSLVLSFLLSVSGLFMADIPSGTWSPLFGMVLLIHLIDAILYYFIRSGKRWAKILFLLLVGLNFVTTVLPLLTGDKEVLQALREDIWGVVKDAITFVADIIALVLLFRNRPA